MGDGVGEMQPTRPTAARNLLGAAGETQMICSLAAHTLTIGCASGALLWLDGMDGWASLEQRRYVRLMADQAARQLATRPRLTLRIWGIASTGG